TRTQEEGQAKGRARARPFFISGHERFPFFHDLRDRRIRSRDRVRPRALAAVRPLGASRAGLDRAGRRRRRARDGAGRCSRRLDPFPRRLSVPSRESARVRGGRVRCVRLGNREPPLRDRKAAMTASAAQPLLALRNVEVIYDHVILVLKGVSLSVGEGQVVALLGANGAGKTTTLKAVSNLLRSERGEVTKGSIELRGRRVDGLDPAELVKRGVVQVMEGRHCFAHLTVEENLLT